MGSISENSETEVGSEVDGVDSADGVEGVEGEVISVGRVIRPEALNDLNNTRADAATDALALHIEHKGQPRKLAATEWPRLLGTLEDVDGRSKPLIEQVSITMALRQGSGETVEVQVTGRRAEQLKGIVGVGDRIVGQAVRGKEGLRLEQYNVYKLAS